MTIKVILNVFHDVKLEFISRINLWPFVIILIIKLNNFFILHVILFYDFDSQL